SWWGAFADDVEDACAEDPDVRLNRGGCEFAPVGELRATMVHAGTAGVEVGSAGWGSDPAGPGPYSPFPLGCRRARSSASGPGGVCVRPGKVRMSVVEYYHRWLQNFQGEPADRMAAALAAVDAFETCERMTDPTAADLQALVAAASSPHKLVFETGCNLLVGL